MNRVVPLAGLLAGALLMCACRGQIRFDEHPPDARFTPSDAAPRCSDVRCGFEEEDECERDGCELECHLRQVCSGTCGRSCSVECEPDSSCDLSTGPQSVARCEAGAHCTLSLGTSSVAACAEGATCTVRCSDACSVQCAPGATCALACADDSSPRPVAGNAACP